MLHYNILFTTLFEIYFSHYKNMNINVLFYSKILKAF